MPLTIAHPVGPSDGDENTGGQKKPPEKAEGDGEAVGGSVRLNLLVALALMDRDCVDVAFGVTAADAVDDEVVPLAVPLALAVDDDVAVADNSVMRLHVAFVIAPIVLLYVPDAHSVWFDEDSGQYEPAGQIVRSVNERDGQ